MKKALALFLILTMLLAVLAACAKEEPMESAGEVSDFSSEKHFDINDLLQNDGSSEEEPVPSSGEPAVSTEEPSQTVSPEQSGDEIPPEESVTSTPTGTPEESQGNQGASSNPPTESTNTPSQGTTGQPSQGTTSTPSQGTTSQPSQGTTSTPSQGGTSQPSQGTTSQPSGELTGEIVASEKKYTYNGNDLMLLHVENKTALHLNLTIKGKYLDKDGKVIKEESQTYTAFPSGWSNYFIFRPKMTFDSFDYTFEVKEFKSDKLYAYNGDPYSKYAELTYSKNLTWYENWYFASAELQFNFELFNRHPSVSIAIQCHILLLDEQGNIYMTDYEYNEAIFGDVESFSGTSCDPIGGLKDGKASCCLKTQPKDADRTIPSNVQGKLTAIFAIESVVDREEAISQAWSQLS